MAFNIKVSQIRDFANEVAGTSAVTANTAKVSFPEAPQDGKQYTRIDGAWVEIVGGVGEQGPAGQNGADGVVDGIALDRQYKKAIENQKGYVTKNYFNKNDLVLGIINNNTDSTVSASATKNISGKIWVSAGDYFLYNVSSAIYGYIQLFQTDGTWIRTERYYNNNLYFNFNMPQDGYLVMDVDNKVTTPKESIMLTDWDARFNLASNIAMVGAYAPYDPYPKSYPKVVYEETENKNDASKWVNPTVADAYNTDWYIDIITNGAKYLTAYDNVGIAQNNNSSNPQIIEFDSGESIIAVQTASANFLGEQDKTKWKRWKLNALTTKVRFCIPFGNTTTYGTITRQFLQDNFRIVLGSHFTKETLPKRVKSINDAVVNKRNVNLLKGKTIALFGDSITAEVGTIGSRSSFAQRWVREEELTVFNFAEGSAGLTDWSDTVVVTDGSPTTTSHNNVVSNQIEEMIAKAIVPDIVILTGGTNDSYRGRVKGTLATAKTNYDTPASQNKQEYYGMFFWAVKRLRDYSPNVKIFLMKPVKAMPVSGFESVNTQMAIVWESYDEVYKELGVKLIDCKDLLYVLGTLANNPYYEDALHPSDLAKDKIMSPFILSELTKAL